jgi:hypothetical protein
MTILRPHVLAYTVSRSVKVSITQCSKCDRRFDRSARDKHVKRGVRFNQKKHGARIKTSSLQRYHSSRRLARSHQVWQDNATNVTNGHRTTFLEWFVNIADCRLPGIDVRRTMSCTGLQPHTLLHRHRLAKVLLGPQNRNVKPNPAKLAGLRQTLRTYHYLKVP